MEIIYLLSLGLLTGLLAGLFGIGGGIIIIPGLWFLLKILHYPGAYLMQMATATALATVMPTTGASAFIHAQHGDIPKRFLKLIPTTCLGTLLGIHVTAFINSLLLQRLFAGLLFLLALRLFFIAESSQEKRAGSLPLFITFSLGLGFVSGILGIGGGIITVPFLSYFAFSPSVVAGISALLGFTISLTGSLSYLVLGFIHSTTHPFSHAYVNWYAFLFIASASILMTPIGVRLSHQLDPKRSKQIFAVLLLSIASLMILVEKGGTG